MSVKLQVARQNYAEKWTDVELDEMSIMFFDVVLAVLNCAFDADDRSDDRRTNDINHFCNANEDMRGGAEIAETTMKMSGFTDVKYSSQEDLRSVEFDHFEYYDEDGDAIAVRTDDELSSFLCVCRDLGTNGEPMRVILKSSRQFPNGSDDGDIDNCKRDIGDCEKDNIMMRGQIQPNDLHFVEKLSEGQFGTVYRALNTKTDNYLAVKSISLDGAMNSRAGILNEIEILRVACASRYIVNFYSAIFVDSELLICLELMDGLSLDHYGKLPSLILGGVTVAVVGGLFYLWSKNIIHRDIKPSNFLVNRRGDVKLSDFGVSKQMAQSVAWSYVGTKVYMAPERINGDLYKIHSDIWSLGVSLLEMALGEFPFGDISNNSTNVKLQSQCKMIDNICHSASMLSRLSTSEEFVAHGAAFHWLIDGCLKTDPFERTLPQEIMESQYLRENTPINRDLIANFVNERLQK